MKTAEEFFKYRYGHSYNTQFDTIEMIKFATQYANQTKEHQDEVGEWISVENKLPELRDKEECYKELPFSINVIMLNSEGHTNIGCFDFTERVWIHDDSENEAHDVTHWMPLPSQPKQY